MIIATMEVPEYFVSANLSTQEKDRILMRYELMKKADNAECKAAVFRSVAEKYNITVVRAKAIYYTEIKRIII